MGSRPGLPLISSIGGTSPIFFSVFFDSKKRFHTTQDGHGGAGACRGTLRGGDVATEVEVERFGASAAIQHPSASVCREAKGLSPAWSINVWRENITGKNRWQE